MLLGLVAMLLPVAVHLLGRRRAPIVHFAALAFVMATNPKQARALRLSEWLLVAVRSLIAALVALALARPLVPVPGDWASGVDAGQQAATVVIVLDDSLSTFAKMGKESVFEHARYAALALIERLPPGSKVSAIASGYPARTLVRQVGLDRGAVLDAVRRLEHKARRDDAARALQLADAMLANTDLDDRRVVVLSDLQATGWQDIIPPWQGRKEVGRQPITLQVDRIRPDSEENTSIIDAVAAPAGDRSQGQLRVDVELMHHGVKPWHDYVTVRAGDREWKSLVQLAPGESTHRSFLLPQSAPMAEILLPSDSLLADNRRLLRLDSGAAVRVALIDGAPRPVPREDEVFFAARALELAAGHAGELAVDVLQLPGLTTASLQDYDVLVLANVGELPSDLLEGLSQAATAGKGILITVGDNLPSDPSTYLPGLLPVPILGDRNAVGQSQGHGGEALRLDPARQDTLVSPLVQRLRQSLDAVALDETLVNHYALVQPSPQVSAAQVLHLAGGAPALLVVGHGRGQVALWTTTLDRDWTDLPLQPGFMPLIHDLCVQLAGDRGLERKNAVAIGDTAILSRDDRADQLEVRIDATGNAPKILLDASSQRGRGWQVSGLLEPGRYTATELRSGAALTARSVIAVPPSVESDLRGVHQGPLLKAWRDVDKRARRAPKVPAWTGVLVVLLLLLGVEGVLLARGSWRLHLRTRRTRAQ